MTTPFFAPPTCFSDGTVRLPEGEARHAAKVLRAKAGDEIVVVDGEGGWHRVRLTHTGRDLAEGEVMETRREVGEAQVEVVLALGILHHRDRFEWAVEKAVELGVTAIIPLRTRRAAPGSVRRDRLESIAIAAMKQSMRSRLPRIGDEMSLDEVVGAYSAAQLLLAHEAAAGAPRPSEVPAAGARVVLIGPEGGFGDAEVAETEAAGAVVVTLGPRRLRAETAALVALADLMLHP